MKRIFCGQIGPAAIAILSVLLVAGCRHQSEPPYEDFANLSEAYEPRAGTGNAWDTYCLAAQKAEQIAKDFKLESSIKPAVRDKFLARMAPVLNSVYEAGRQPCQPQFIVTDPFLPRPFHAGFSAIGHALAYQIQVAGKNGSANSASTPVLAAHRIATALQGGDAQDAMLGFWIASRAREEAAGLLPKMDAGTLQKLGESILQVYESDPSVTIANEEKSMLGGVQFVQNALKNEDWELLDQAFYKRASTAIAHLKDLKGVKRVEYFRGFAQEARDRAADVRVRIVQPAAERAEFHEPTGERPWKRFSSHLFNPIEVYMTMYDRHVARCRLFALTCLSLSGGKSTGQAPATFKTVDPRHLIDPYSGRNLRYRVAGREFKIYSVGTDGRDDAGETNSEGLEPDLTLEPLGS